MKIRVKVTNYRVVSATKQDEAWVEKTEDFAVPVDQEKNFKKLIKNPAIKVLECVKIGEKRVLCEIPSAVVLGYEVKEGDEQ